ncbi:MAG: maleylpyruvate isomerase N-terminal domain-containing protein, partial [Mycobacterium sp.]
MAGAAPMVTDLRAESDALDTLVGDLPPARWATDTPAPGWTIAHQIAHLLWTDQVALTAVTDGPGFAEILGRAAENPTGFVDAGAEELAALPAARLLADWRATRAALHDELLTVADGRKLPWFGPPM